MKHPNAPIHLILTEMASICHIEMEINLKFDNLVESSLNVPTHLKIQGKMKHVSGGMYFPELLMRSIHAESTCLLQGHKSEY